MRLSAPYPAFVQETPIESQPPPVFVAGPIAWIRRKLFSGPLNIILTLLCLYALYVIIPPLIDFFLLKAVWTGADRDACLTLADGSPAGACWAYVRVKLGYFIYGSYPIELHWRVNTAFFLGAFGLAWILWLDAPHRGLGALYFFVVYPIIAFVLLRGFETVGLSTVDTSLWGGILVTLVISYFGIILSLPIGVFLALGRRSKLPLVRIICIIFIEFVRGVPLVTVLFMANTMLPLFLPGNASPDRLLRALVGVALFAGAYMAEVVRGGLQAIPKGQYEGAQSLGLGYWGMTRMIVLPQALRIVIPGIVNAVISLFKDTTLVFIVGLFDFLKAIDVTLADPTWATPNTRFSGYAFAAFFYFMCCYGMSRYSRAIERRLRRERTDES